jgi:glycosyltransferase involved in cell wall biosynthesis
MLRVSVITATFNTVDCIRGVLESVKSQAYPGIEHVIIDGGSTDGTLEIIRGYSDQLGYVVSEPDRGIYHAMNKGLAAATGDILFFLNADDRFFDNRVVEDVVTLFEQKPDLEIVYGNLMWDVAGTWVQRKQPVTITREFLASTTILHQTVFARKQVFETTGGFSEEYKIVSDYDWMLKVFVRDRRNYFYYDRDIAIMRTGGRSWTTKWEGERVSAMRKYFAPYEILKYRTWPRFRSRLTKLRHDTFAGFWRR